MKAKLQTPKGLQSPEQQAHSTSSSPISPASSNRILKNSKTNYYLSKTPRTSSSIKKSSRVESMLLDSQCIKLRQQFENTLEDENKNSNKLDFSQIETNQLNRFISHLREYTQNCAIEGHYEEARRSQFIESKAKSVLEKRITKIKPTIKIVEDQKESKSNFEQRWRNKFNEYENETNEKREELQRKHAHETRIFEKIWARDMPQKYRKPSQRLLQLMQIEKSLAISGEIDHADYIHTQVVSQTQIEIENAQSNLIHDYQIAKAKHLEKQSNEMVRFEQIRNHGKDLLDADYRAEMLRVNHRDLVVQVQVKESILKAKMDQSPPTRSAGVPKNRDATITSLLPRLIAPNDPLVIKNKKNRRKHIYGKQQEFHKKTIEALKAESKDNRRKKRNENVSNSIYLNEHIEKENNSINFNQQIDKIIEKVDIQTKSSSAFLDHNSQSSPLKREEVNGEITAVEGQNTEIPNNCTEEASEEQKSAEIGMRVDQKTHEATPVYSEQPHFTSPAASESGFNSQSYVFESSATIFADTNPRSRYQSEFEIGQKGEKKESNYEQETVNENLNDQNTKNLNSCPNKLNDDQKNLNDCQNKLNYSENNLNDFRNILNWDQNELNSTQKELNENLEEVNENKFALDSNDFILRSVQNDDNSIISSAQMNDVGNLDSSIFTTANKSEDESANDQNNDTSSGNDDQSEKDGPNIQTIASQIADSLVC